jgi:hypothetical protein
MKTTPSNHPKKFYSYSIRVHIVTFLCFLLPFFHHGCKKAETTEGTATDSVAVDAPVEEADSAIEGVNASTILDSAFTKIKINTDSLTQSNNPSSPTDSLQNKKSVATRNNDKEGLSTIIFNKYPFLSPILITEDSNYSGFAEVIDLLPMYSYFSILNVSLFWAMSLFIKFIDSNSWKAIILLEILTVLNLYVSGSFEFFHQILWGYWVSMIIISALTFFDIFAYWTSRRFKQ